MIIHTTEGLLDINSLDVDCPSHIWVLDLEPSMNDYKLAPLLVLERVRTPVLIIDSPLGGIKLPPDWYIMISDGQYEFDIVKVKESLSKDYSIAIHGPNDTGILRTMDLRVVDYKADDFIYVPMVTRNEMICCSVSHERWMHVAPTLTQKLLKSFDFYDL